MWPGRDVLVAGSIGPLERAAPRPGAPARARRCARRFREQIEGLLEGGVDLLVFETFSDLDELLLGDRGGAPPVATCRSSPQMTFGEDLVAIDGTSPQTAATALAAAGVDARRRQLRRRARSSASTRSTQMGRPSAGLAAARSCPTPACPQRVEGQFVYAAGPAYFARGGAALPGRRRAASSAAAAARRRSTSRRMRQALDRELARERGHGSRSPPREPRRGDGAALAARADRRARRDRRARPSAPPPTRPRPAARREAVRRSASRSTRRVGAHRAHDRGRPAAPGGGRRPRQHQRQRHGARAHGRDGRRVRHPARPRPRVPGPLHDARPQPDGARVGAARRPRARRAQHPGADRRPAARRRLPERHRHLGRRFDRASSASSAGSTAARTRPASRSARRPASRSPARSTPPPATSSTSSTGWRASSRPAPT